MADDIESIQLDMADEFLKHAADLPDGIEATAQQVRFLADRLTELPQQIVRVAESRLDVLLPVRPEPRAEEDEPDKELP
ncbi:hypothetical protein ACH4EC_28650 [Streptomyces anulatus]